MGPKKGIKMDLGSFLADESYGGSWADDDLDLSSISIPTKAPGHQGQQQAHPEDKFGFGGRSGSLRQEREPRRERTEFPVPENPPYKARVANLPWDVEETELKDWFIKGLLTKGENIEDVSIPKDQETGKARGFAFVIFNSKALLEDALNLSNTSLNGRTIFVNVAAPAKQDGFDLDWSAARTGSQNQAFGNNRRERGPRREPQEFDFGSARDSKDDSHYQQRQRSRRGGDEQQQQQQQQQDFDFSSARESNDRPAHAFQPREGRAAGGAPGAPGGFERRRSRREPQEFDFSSARESQMKPQNQHSEREEPAGERRERKPKREEPEVDWSSARQTQEAPAGQQQQVGDKRERRERRDRKPRKPETELDWSASRDGQAPPKERKPRKSETELDWNSKSHTQQIKPERKPKKPEPELDWSVARTGQTLAPKEKKFGRSSSSSLSKKDKQTSQQQQQHQNKRQQAKKEDKTEETPVSEIKKSSYDVLAVEDDEEEEEEEEQETQETQETQKESDLQNKETNLQEETAKLSIKERETDGWEVVGNGKK
ncbi:hypothetical protein PACTADRAFT_48942 [Pachysolen tannophilus NRRL Y-2460]|uniref:RRM domain-containing protein n=1 Tax=Pachysolen tannophilus NRRL Y-2460 TaxID=669874 RepID=A0A1E4TZK8_PACTA|nr:hypothetical protein PACTADRAFT_48942 [Pachysolen tannophilus NRRL Y-2460]